MSNDSSKDVPPAAAASTPAPAAQAISESILHAVLNDRQKRKLGLLPKREPTEKEVARLEALRERMRAMNNARKEAKLKRIPEVKVAAAKPKPTKRKIVEESESSEESESDQYIQKKAKKVNKTLQQLSRVEQHMQQLKQVQQTNPFYNLLRR